MINILLPKSSEKFKMKVPKDILIEELSKEIEFGVSNQILYNETSKNFTGQLKGEKFEFKLNTTYRNSFNPIINLSFIELEEHTEIWLEYRLEPIVKGIILFLIIMLMIVQILFFYFKFNDFTIEYFSPTLMLIGLMTFSRMGFYMSLGHSEAIIKKNILRTRNKYYKENGLIH